MANENLSLQLKIKASAEGFAQVKAALNDLKKQFPSIEFLDVNKTSDATSSIKKLAGQFALFAGAAYAAKKALDSVGDAFSAIAKEGINFNSELEDAGIGIASVVNSLREYRTQTDSVVDGSISFAASQKEVREVLKSLQKDGLNTAATFGELVNAFQAATPLALKAGLSLDQIRRIAVLTAQGAKALTIPMNQLNQEIRSLFTGDTDRNSRLNQVLQIRQEDLNRAKQAGDVFGLIEGKLKKFADATPAISNSFSVLKSNLFDAFQFLSSQATKGLFDQLKISFNDILNSLIDTSSGEIKISEKFKPVFDSIKGLFDDISNSIKNSPNFIEDFFKNIKNISEDLRKLQSVLFPILEFTNKNMQSIAILFETIASAFFFTKAIQYGTSLVSVFSKITPIIAAIPAILVDIGGIISGFAASEAFASLLVTLRGVVAVIAGIGGGPAIAVGSLIGLVVTLAFNWERVVTSVKEFLGITEKIDKNLEKNQKANQFLSADEDLISKIKEDRSYKLKVTPVADRLNDSQMKDIRSKLQDSLKALERDLELNLGYNKQDLDNNLITLKEFFDNNQNLYSDFESKAKVIVKRIADNLRSIGKTSEAKELEIKYKIVLDQKNPELEIKADIEAIQEKLNNYELQINTKVADTDLQGSFKNYFKENVVKTKSQEIQELRDSIAELRSKPLISQDQLNGLTTLEQKLNDLQRPVDNFRNSILSSLDSNLDGVIQSLLDGTESVGKAFSNMAKSILDDITKIIIKSLILKSISGLFGTGGGEASASSFGSATQSTGYNLGGNFRFADGGLVRGAGTSTSDSIPARLSHGEFVVNAATVNKFGQDFFYKLQQYAKTGMSSFNAGGFVNNISKLKSGLDVPRFASGGFVNTTAQPNVSLNVINKGSEKQVTNQSTSFDANGMVVSIILEDLKKGGAISNNIQGVFGLKRQVTA